MHYLAVERIMQEKPKIQIMKSLKSRKERSKRSLQRQCAASNSLRNPRPLSDPFSS